MPPAGKTLMGKFSSFKKSKISFVISLRLLALFTSLKPRWPPAKGPSTIIRSGTLSIFSHLFKIILMPLEMKQ